MFKNILPALFAAFLLGCGGCENTENVESSVESPITWDSCSQTIGDHPCDFTLKDQNGNDWNLYENYGSIIILDFSTEWCYYCQVAASESAAFMSNYTGDDVVYITIMMEDMYGNSPPNESRINEWVSYFQIEEPVLYGDRSMIDSSGELGWPIEAWPMFFIIDREMVLTQVMKGYNGSNLMTAIDSILVEE